MFLFFFTMVIFLRDPKKTSCYYMLICQSAISSCCWFEVAAEIKFTKFTPLQKEFLQRFRVPG